MNKEKVIIIGNDGNVGRGIVKALSDNYSVTGIDVTSGKGIEDYSAEELKEMLHEGIDIVYAAEVGNRDEYETNLNLSEENNQRFREFCLKITGTGIAVRLHYIGGSWTKRGIEGLLVSDASPNKDLHDANAYEKAKISAEENAETLAAELNLDISFYDWASVVPNFAPNFSIYKMTQEALDEGQITYSPGDYGRPLLHAVDAGRALRLIAEAEGDIISGKFRKYLIPGVFTPFSKFAEIVREIVEDKTGKKIKLVEQKETPEFLKTKSESKHLKELGFKGSKEMVEEGLRETCEVALRDLGED
ncbi:MAG TPA: NAD(P)-dependent oxidoreductase [bacterium]|nr:NAD(P)-dependent oxidoreductase [bacterium]